MPVARLDNSGFPVKERSDGSSNHPDLELARREMLEEPFVAALMKGGVRGWRLLVPLLFEC